ncbi:Cleavage stimulation factor subunit 2 [Chytridiales sp. JEL 0842]|nr:Cleavage stimulation factor subunit 2 [Chytridiales sp. JEL 0842]
MSRVVFDDVPETQLVDIFKEVGPVVSFRLVFDKETGKPKGFGFCTFQDAETAASAVRNLNNYDLGGRQLRVDFADNEKDDAQAYTSDKKPQPQAPLSSAPGVASTETITKTLESIPANQLLEVMSQMKFLAQSNPDQVRTLLLANPQLAYAIFQALLAMNVVDGAVIQRIAQGQTGLGIRPGAPSTGYMPAVPAPAPVVQPPMIFQSKTTSPASLSIRGTSKKLHAMSTRAEIIEERLHHLIEDMKDRQGRRNSVQLIQEFKEKIHAIDEEYSEAAIHERDGSIAPGQAVISELLEEAHELSSELLENAIDEEEEEGDE